MIIRKPFYFLRHGQTDWNREGRKQGQTDIPLNECGREQAHHVQKQVQQLGIGAIFYSPLSRARETMVLATEQLIDCPRIVIDELQERSFGTVEGRLKNASWQAIWDEAPPGGEMRQDFFDRIARGVNKALSATDETILIVAHAGTFRAISHHIGMTSHSAIHNGQLVYICPESDGTWAVETL